MKNIDAKEIQEKLTAKIIEALEQGKAQGAKWKRPWQSAGDVARNVSGYVYNGTNQWSLTMTATMTGRRNIWATPKQWGELARKRGETYDFRGVKCSAEVYVPNTFMVEKKDKDKDGKEVTSRFPIVRSFKVSPVMSISDIKGTETLLAEIDAKNPVNDHARHEQAERFIAAQNAVVTFGGDSAHYTPTTDSVSMPALNQFDRAENYYATFIHELTHRTGHASRLARPGIVNFDRFGSERYAEEELVAELGAAFTMNALGISGETLDNHAAYIDSWLGKLRRDTKFIFKASKQASDAMSYMLKAAGMLPEVGA